PAFWLDIFNSECCKKGNLSGILIYGRQIAIRASKCLPINEATEVQIKSIPPLSFQFAITIGLRFFTCSFIIFACLIQVYSRLFALNGFVSGNPPETLF